MIVDMRTDKHLVVNFDAPNDKRGVIIDKDEQDIRLYDGQTIIKVTFNHETKKANAVLVDDIYMWTGEKS